MWLFPQCTAAYLSKLDPPSQHEVAPSAQDDEECAEYDEVIVELSTIHVHLFEYIFWAAEYAVFFITGEVLTVETIHGLEDSFKWVSETNNEIYNLNALEEMASFPQKSPTEYSNDF